MDPFQQKDTAENVLNRFLSEAPAVEIDASDMIDDVTGEQYEGFVRLTTAE